MAASCLLCLHITTVNLTFNFLGKTILLVLLWQSSFLPQEREERGKVLLWALSISRGQPLVCSMNNSVGINTEQKISKLIFFSIK